MKRKAPPKAGRAGVSRQSLSSVERLTQTKRVADAYERLMIKLASIRVNEAPSVVLTLIRTFEKAERRNLLSQEQRAWLLNERGLALRGLGQLQEATSAFEQMLRLGRRLKDRAVIRIALFNLGLVAHSSGNEAQANRRYRQSLDLAVEDKDYETATKILLNVANNLTESGQLSEAVATLTIVQRILREAPDDDLRASLYLGLGQVAAKQHRFAAAEKHFRKSLMYSRRSKNALKEATIVQNIGASLLDQGELRSSARWLRRAVTVASRVGATYLAVLAAQALAVALLRMGRQKEAMAELNEVRKSARRLDDTRSAAMASADLGALEIEAGQFRRARILLAEGLIAFRAAGDSEWLTRTLRNSIELARRKKSGVELDRTINLGMQALPVRNHTQRASLLEKAGDSWLDLAQGESKAEAYYRRAVREETASGEIDLASWRSARAAAQMRDRVDALPAAEKFFSDALTGYLRGRNHQMIFHVRNDRALVYERLGQLTRARRDLETCVRLARKQKDRRMLILATMNLGEVERRAGRPRRALPLCREAVRLSRSLDDRRSEMEALGNLGITYSDLGRWQDARTSFNTLLRSSRSFSDRKSEATALGGIAGIDFARHHYKSALNNYRRAVAVARPRSRQDKVHVAEHIAGLIESLSAMGRSRQLQRYAQKLVDLTQDIGETQLASEALARSARWWLRRGDFKLASEIYADSLLLAPIGAGDNKAAATRILEAALLMAFHIEDEALPDKDSFYRRVLDRLDAKVAGVRDKLQSLFTRVQRQAVATLAESN